MAIKKSELYSSLWSSCDELRGGMDASQYKDYVLVMLFIKYVSDKYAGQPFAPITIPPGASFKDMVDRLTNLIAIFENKALDFSKNRAEGDDILGDAYEYLMRHFATESGKSKGQFYTPAEVSRIMARIIGIDQAATSGLARMNMILHDNPGAEIKQSMMQNLLTDRVRLV
ncbi:type I restriction enzyme M protein [Nitrosomonas oligotropha]|uniref:site-specific DNA-methyltransferase (adenine-specific) n=1 Tax=Nitrosomonas oligotropha TaxID=42354 RepID=A0A2T5HIP2_9PROT|nr:N-6 DNA methylase [Nitrosomonas oligotropha]PTQ71451.1 type I restriction enzyme M protein [Nitrosomonas oligotropha]